MAVYCTGVAPTTIEEFAGVTAMETSVAGVTVRTVEPLIEPEVAWIVDVPVPTAVATLPAMVATLVVPEDHVTELVRFCVLLSL